MTTVPVLNTVSTSVILIPVNFLIVTYLIVNCPWRIPEKAYKQFAGSHKYINFNICF